MKEFWNTSFKRLTKTLIKKTISKEWNLTQFLTEGGQMQDIKRQETDIKSEQPETEAISRVEAATASLQPQFPRRRWHQEIDHRQRSGQTQRQCDFCGYNHGKEDRCPVIGKICRNFNKRNHFSSVCLAPNSKGTKAPRQYEQTGRIKQVLMIYASHRKSNTYSRPRKSKIEALARQCVYDWTT